MSNELKITDDVLNGGYDLINLKDTLEQITDNLDLLAKNEEGTNLYDPNAIGIIVYDTPYERTMFIEEKIENDESLRDKLTASEAELDEYLNDNNSEFVKRCIQDIGRFDMEYWQQMVSNAYQNGSIMGSILDYGKELGDGFLRAVEKYYNDYCAVETNVGRIVGIYKNNGEETSFDSPENLIGFAYISNLNFFESDAGDEFDATDVIKEIIDDGISSKLVGDMVSQLSQSDGIVLKRVVGTLNSMKTVSDALNYDPAEMREILIEDIEGLYGSGNLSGLNSKQLRCLKLIKCACDFTSGRFLSISPLLSGAISYSLNNFYKFIQNSKSIQNGLTELSRYGSIDSLSDIFQGQSYKKEFEVKDNSNFSNVFGDNTLIG